MVLKCCKVFFLIFLILSSCSPKFHFSEISYVQDFILDSYKINKGKKEILSLMKESFCEISKKDFEIQKYKLEEDDVLNISIFHPIRKDLEEKIQKLSDLNFFQIKNGKINIPNFDEIFILGLQIEEVAHLITSKFTDEIKNVKVFVNLKKSKEKTVEIVGLIHGIHKIDEKTTIFDILSKIGLPPNCDLFKSCIIRDNKKLLIDFVKLLKEGDMNENILLRDSDKIFIPGDGESKIFVMGEVSKQSLINMPLGTITLKEAILKAGGFLHSSNTNSIQIIRTAFFNPKIYNINFSDIIAL